MSFIQTCDGCMEFTLRSIKYGRGQNRGVSFDGPEGRWESWDTVGRAISEVSDWSEVSFWSATADRPPYNRCLTR